MCSIYMIIRRYEVFFQSFVNKKNGESDESPPKRRAMAETSGLKIDVGCYFLHARVTIARSHNAFARAIVTSTSERKRSQ